MSSTRRNRIVHVGEAMRAFLAPRHIAPGVQGAQVIELWETIVGSPMAHGAVPVRIADGVLTLRPRDSVWRSELLMRRSELRAKVNAYFGEEVLQRVEIE